jgi:hypothetical protein
MKKRPMKERTMTMTTTTTKLDRYVEMAMFLSSISAVKVSK